MTDFVQLFDERLQEVESYLDLLESLEQQTQEGPPRIGESGSIITVQQQKILYSSVYLQLYNLVESTITRCISAFSEVIEGDCCYHPANLSEHFLKEWVRCTARTHTDLNYENRLRSALDLCNHIVQANPISSFRIEKGGGGNWDDVSIEEISCRLGLTLNVSSGIYSGIKRSYKNDEGPLIFIRKLRNKLAHGSLSFAECGEGTTVSELRVLTELTASYLREVANSFQRSINAFEFLTPERRSVIPRTCDQS